MIILAIILFVLIIYVITKYNFFKKKRLQVEQAKKAIDIYLKQRFDLIPNLVEVVKGEKEYEKEVLESLVKLRADATKDGNLSEKAKLNEEYNRVLLLAESYPELKANKSFLNLQKQLTKMENQLQAARRIYNVEVTEYNTAIVTVPKNIIAGMFGFKEVEYFEVSNEEKENISIKIDNEWALRLIFCVTQHFDKYDMQSFLKLSYL